MKPSTVALECASSKPSKEKERLSLSRLGRTEKESGPMMLSYASLAGGHKKYQE
jgi:hypothetical protein